MNNRFFIPIIFFIVSGYLHAQIIFPLSPKSEELKNLKESTLYVALLDTSGANQEFSKEYNRTISEAVKSRWTFSKYEFVGISRILDMKEQKNESYVLIPTEIETINFGVKPLNRDVFNTRMSYLSIGKCIDIKVKKKLMGNNYALLFNAPTIQSITGSYYYTSVITAIKEIQSKAQAVLASKEEKEELKNAQKGANVKLRTKTLLLDKDLLDKGLNENIIKEIYKYPFKIVSSDEIVKTIQSKNSGYAFIQIEPISVEKAFDMLFVKSTDDLQALIVIGFSRGSALGDKKIKEINELASRDKK